MRSARFVGVCLMTVAALSPAPLEAQESIPVASMEGLSRWGMRADSSTVRFENPRRPLWERTLYLPYRVVGLPFELLGTATRVSVTFLDESRAIARIGQLLGPRTGPFGAVVNVRAGGLSGFGGGVTLLHDRFFGPDNHLKLQSQATDRGVRRVTLGARIEAGTLGGFELGAGHRLRPDARYFGLGPRSSRRDVSRFEQELNWTGLTWRRPLGSPPPLAASTAFGPPLEGRGWRFDAGVLWSIVGARATRGRFGPALREVFADDLPVGYGGHSAGIAWSGALIHDDANNEGRPDRGGVRRLKVARFHGIEGVGADHWMFRGEAQQFVRLWAPQRNLALRAVASWIEPIDGGSVAFARLHTNDDPDLLRGYDDFRFRDRGLLIGSAEYRWPIWVERSAEEGGVDAYLLTDIGQVFGETREISRRNVTTSVGGGLRLVSRTGMIGRLEIAFGPDETVLRLRSDQIFQFTRGGLYHGREPVPTR